MNTLISNENDNGNDGKRNKPPIWIVDREAQRLVDKYENPEGWLLYCRSINYISFPRILELEKKADTGKQPGHLLTVLLSQELERLNVSSNKFDKRLKEFKKHYGEF